MRKLKFGTVTPFVRLFKGSKECNGSGLIVADASCVGVHGRKMRPPRFRREQRIGREQRIEGRKGIDYPTELVSVDSGFCTVS